VCHCDTEQAQVGRSLFVSTPGSFLVSDNAKTKIPASNLNGTSVLRSSKVHIKALVSGPAAAQAVNRCGQRLGDDAERERFVRRFLRALDR